MLKLISWMALSIVLSYTIAFAGLINDETAFVNSLASGHVEDFGNVSLGTGSVDFNGGSNGFFYNISAQTGLFALSSALSTNAFYVPLIITFSSSVTAVGGQFFLTDYEGRDLNGTVTITLADSQTPYVADGGRAFWGYTSDVPILSLSFLSSVSGDYYSTVDHLIVGSTTGSPVPIPAAVWLFGSGLVGLIGLRKRFKK